MANITQLSNAPTTTRSDVKELCAAIGPIVLGDKWPNDVDPAALTAAQTAQIFELITREFWRQQIQEFKANVAAEAARQSAVTATQSDPFE